MVSVRKRGKVYQYQFDVAPINGKRKRVTKSGFKTKADPDKEVVEKYIKDSDMYGLFEHDKLLAEIIITKVDKDTCELKNIATIEDARGKGYEKK